MPDNKGRLIRSSIQVRVHVIALIWVCGNIASSHAVVKVKTHGGMRSFTPTDNVLNDKDQFASCGRRCGSFHQQSLNSNQALASSAWHPAQPQGHHTSAALLYVIFFLVLCCCKSLCSSNSSQIDTQPSINLPKRSDPWGLLVFGLITIKIPPWLLISWVPFDIEQNWEVFHCL